jgi:N-acetylglutamate synthase-like GNAT family acetyltransferase
MIRQFQAGDASSCCQLIHECLANDSSLSSALRERIGISESPQSMEERARLFYVAVCELEGRIAGLVGLDMNEIRLLYVLPGCQRRGIGRQLFEHIQTMVPKVLFPDIFVYASLQAVDFYRACGFIDRGPFTFDVRGEPLHTIFMTFSIPFAD